MTQAANPARLADLHLHSHFSDGTYTPDKLVRAARSNGLCAIALTDHDTLDGVAETLETGKRLGIEVIPGVEITSRVGDKEVHILGYFFDDGWQNPQLRAVLTHSKRLREQRIVEFAARFRQLGIALSVADIRACAGCGTLGRMHVAQALVRRGAVKSVEEAFERFLKPGKPGYVDRPRMTAAEAIGHILRAGGIAALAHPGLNNVDERIPDLAAQGLAGLEVWHSRHTPSDTNRYRKLAKRLELLPTGGSDCHGSMHSQARIGTVKIPYEHVAALRACRP
jgi:hypothetical protein